MTPSLNIPRVLALAMAVLWGAAPSLRAQQPEDTVLLRNGRRVDGVVTAEDGAGLTLQDPKNKAVVQTLKWTEIESVDYGDAPAAFTEARQHFNDGKWQEAAQGFDAARKEKARAWILPQAKFWAASALANAGQEDEAVGRFLALAEEHPKSRRAGEGLMRAFELRRARGDTAGAQKVIAALEKTAPTLGPSFTARAKLMHAQLQEKDGTLDEAMRAYDALAGDADPGVKTEATLGRIRVLSAQKKWADLERACRGFLGRDDRRLTAAAAVGLGDALHAKASTEKSLPLYREALLSYLRAAVLEYPLPGEPVTDYLRGTYMAGQCYEAMAGLAAGAEAQTAFREAAAFHYGQILADHPKSEWAKKAAERTSGGGAKKGS